MNFRAGMAALFFAALFSILVFLGEMYGTIM
jgi:hypothetical protein